MSLHNSEIQDLIGVAGQRDLEGVGVTDHAMERYVSRIKGHADHYSCKQYIAQNKDVVEEHIKHTFQYAECLYVGDLRDKKQKKFGYMLNNDIGLIYDIKNKSIVTLFRIVFDVPTKSDVILNDFVQALYDEYEQYDLTAIEYQKQSDSIAGEQSIIDNKIELLELQIKQLKSERKELEMRKGRYKNSVVASEYRIRELAMRLFRDSDFKV